MGLLLLMMTVGGIGAAFFLLLISLYRKKIWLTKFVFGAVVGWFAFYAVFLIGTSLLSREKTLGLNEAKEFCGFYLDCHMHTAVSSVRKTKQIGGREAQGEFYIVRLKVFSDAENPSVTMRLVAPKAVVRDEGGNIYERQAEAEDLLPTAKVPLGRDVKTETPFEKEIVFDLPADVKTPKLDVSEGYGIDRVIETVLIGDEDSVFHERTLFDMTASGQTAGLSR